VARRDCSGRCVVRSRSSARRVTRATAIAVDVVVIVTSAHVEFRPSCEPLHGSQGLRREASFRHAFKQQGGVLERSQVVAAFRGFGPESSRGCEVRCPIVAVRLFAERVKGPQGRLGYQITLLSCQDLKFISSRDILTFKQVGEGKSTEGA
jgi:hypothetical protein